MKERSTWISVIFSDKAVLYGVLKNAWAILAATVTVPLIIIFFSPELQGYYYAFKSILEIQSLFLLGIGVVIQQFTSHEWANLRFDDRGAITGDRRALSRLSGLRSFAVRWYGVVSLLVIFGLGIGGYLFLLIAPGDTSLPVRVWFFPWMALCIVTGFQLLISPSLVFLEGCNQVDAVNKFRLIQGIFSRSFIWLVLIIGGGLWVFFAGTTINILCILVFIFGRYRFFFYSLFKSPIGEKFNWSKDIWPMQWRIAITYVAGYINISLLTPILFAFHGPVIAGRLGMTWSIILTFWGFSTIFISTQMPSWAIAAANKDTKNLDKLFYKYSMISSTILVSGLTVICACIAIFRMLDMDIGNRFLPPVSSILFACSVICMHLRYAFTTYVRAHKQELFWPLSILEGILSAVLLPYLGMILGAIGLSVGFLLVSAVTAGCSFYIFLRFKRLG